MPEFPEYLPCLPNQRDDDVLIKDWIKKPHGSISSFAVAGAGRHRCRSPNIKI
jgi:hypothetical protein